MPARTGQEYITGLKERPREVWIDGELVRDVTAHPAFRNGVKSVAALYDMQHDPGLREEMTYASPSTGQPVGLSFQIPQTIADLERKREMMARWAWASCGMMGRSPDFLNVIFTAWAGASDYFAQNRPEFKQNVLDYYEFIRESDVTLTHALVNLQRRRAPTAADTLSDEVALTLVKETDAGIVVKGSRVLATPGPHLRRNRHLPRRQPPGGRRRRPLLLFLLHSLRYPGPEVPLPGELRPGPLPLQPSPGLPLRGDGLSGVLRQRAGALGTGVPAGRRGAVQQLRHGHPVQRPHRAPGADPLRREGGVHPWAWPTSLLKPWAPAPSPTCRNRWRS